MITIRLLYKRFFFFLSTTKNIGLITKILLSVHSLFFAVVRVVLIYERKENNIEFDCTYTICRGTIDNINITACSTSQRIRSHTITMVKTCKLELYT